MAVSRLHVELGNDRAALIIEALQVIINRQLRVLFLHIEQVDSLADSRQVQRVSA